MRPDIDTFVVPPERVERLARAYHDDGRPRWPWWCRARRRSTVAIATAVSMLLAAGALTLWLAISALGGA